MRRILLFFAAILLSLTSIAAELNIYASGLQAGTPDVSNNVQINYLLNAPATALEFQLLNGSAIITTVAITDNTLLTKGSHTATIALNNVPSGTYTWALKASAAATTAVTEVTASNPDNMYSFYSPQGVTVDNSFESPYFGRVYVAESTNGAANGGTTTTKTQKRGVFIYDATLNFVYNQNNVGFAGNVNWSASRHGCRRVKTDAQGYVYVCDNDAVSNAYRMDPANPSNDFVPILDYSKRTQIYNKVNAIELMGEGEDLRMVAIDYSDAIVSFPIGTGIPYASAPDTLANLAQYNHVNSESSLSTDAHGGWWTFQNRGQLDTYPMMMHIDSKGVADFRISSTYNSTMAPSTASRGGGGVNCDGSLVALGGESVVNMYNVTYDENGQVTVVKSDWTFPTIGTNIENIAFDVANNVYVVSAASEKLHVYATPKADNSFVTPAPKANTIQVVNANNIVAWALDGGKYFPYSSKAELVADFTADYNSINGQSRNWSSASASTIWDETYTTAGTALRNVFITNSELASKWAWLKNYLEKVTTDEGLTSSAAGINQGTEQYLRSAIAGFLTNSQSAGANYYPGADFSEAGKLEKWAAYYEGGSYPTTITSTYVIPAPYIENKVFEGWYDNPNFTGDKYTQIDETFNGTLYAHYLSIPVTSVELNLESTTIHYGDVVNLVATIYPLNAANQNVSWTSNNPGVASVLEGVVTGVSKGTATITATTADGGFTANCIVTVTGEHMITGDNILWVKNDATLSYGDITAIENKYRDLAYYDGILYVLTNPVVDGFNRILKLDAETGDYLGMVDVNAVWGGDIPLSSIQILDNGEMVAMNCRVNPTTGTVKFYGWDNPNATCTLLGETKLDYPNRVEALYYQGTLAEGAFYCAMYDSYYTAVIPIMNKAIVADEISYITTNTYKNKIATRVSSVSSNEILSVGQSYFCGWTLTGNTGAITYWMNAALNDGSSNHLYSNALQFFEYNGKKYFASVDYFDDINGKTMTNPKITINKYTGLSRWAASGRSIIYSSPTGLLPSATQNTSFQHGIAVRVNKDGYSVWMCSLNQGIIAYRYMDPTTPPTPNANLMVADGSTEAGWVNFGSKVLGEGNYSDSKEYKLVVEDINLSTVVLSIEGISGFTTTQPDANGNFTISYEVPATTSQAYKGRLVVDGKDILGNVISSIDFPISLDINEDGTTTAIDNINANVSVQKIMRDGHIYIIRNGIMYNVAGQIVK